jgi:S1-C subfamily serine protease
MQEAHHMTAETAQPAQPAQPTGTTGGATEGTGGAAGAGAGSGQVLGAFSDALAGAVARAGVSIVRVDARRRSAASGVVWGPGGLILTADHVLERDEDVTVGLPDGRTVGATIVGRDSGSDVALLRLAAEAQLTPIARGGAPRVGSLVMLVARPGAGLATSLGVVSAIGGPSRTRWGGTLEGTIRTDATFFPGFSGGAVVDPEGRMLGLATSYRGWDYGLGIPLETLERVTGALTSHGRVKRGYLGISSQPVAIPEPLRQKLELEQESGLLLVGVESGSPAERGGLLLGDVLVSFAGQPVRHTDDLLAALGPERVGQPSPARVIRGGEPRDLSVVAGERP